MQVEIEEEPDYDGEVKITIRDPRTGKKKYSFYGDPSDWVPND